MGIHKIKGKNSLFVVETFDFRSKSCRLGDEHEHGNILSCQTFDSYVGKGMREQEAPPRSNFKSPQNVLSVLNPVYMQNAIIQDASKENIKLGRCDLRAIA